MVSVQILQAIFQDTVKKIQVIFSFNSILDSGVIPIFNEALTA